MRSIRGFRGRDCGRDQRLGVWGKDCYAILIIKNSWTETMWLVKVMVCTTPYFTVSNLLVSFCDWHYLLVTDCYHPKAIH